MLALSSEAVGVDIERIRAINWRRLASRFFHPDEQRFFGGRGRSAGDVLYHMDAQGKLPQGRRGQGFSVSPKTFCILPEGDSAVLQGETAYLFRSLPAPEGYRLSVCARESEIADHVIFRSF